MKIMFCLGSLDKGGAERVVCNLANYFVDGGDEVVIIVTKLNGIGYELNKTVKIDVLDSEKTGKVFRNIKRIRRMRKIILEESPDVILGFLQEPIARMLVLKKISKKVKRIPFIVSIRIDPKIAFGTLKRKISLSLYDLADGFVFQTDEMKEWFSKKIQDKSVVIPNPVNKDFLCKPYDGERKKVVVNVGRLTEQKNQKMLISAFAEFKKTFPDFKLKIYGEGPLREELQKQIDDLGISEDAKLVGVVSNIKDEIYDASMFVLSSNYEGMSNALMEAMALGMPSISTDCPPGGSRFLIRNNEEGILVKVGDIGELANAMCKIAEDKKFARAISVTGHKKMLELNPKNVNDEWKKFIVNGIKRWN